MSKRAGRTPVARGDKDFLASPQRAEAELRRRRAGDAEPIIKLARLSIRMIEELGMLREVHAWLRKFTKRLGAIKPPPPYVPPKDDDVAGRSPIAAKLKDAALSVSLLQLVFLHFQQLGSGLAAVLGDWPDLSMLREPATAMAALVTKEVAAHGYRPLIPTELMILAVAAGAEDPTEDKRMRLDVWRHRIDKIERIAKEFTKLVENSPTPSS